MKTLINLIMLYVVYVVASYSYAENLSWTAWKIFKSNGLPHRSLGYFFSAYNSSPHRSDYAKDYLINAYLLRKNERILEGAKPDAWLEMMIVRESKVNHPRSFELHGLSKMVMREHFKLFPTVESEELEK